MKYATGLGVLAIIALLGWGVTSRSSDSDIVSTRGLHWHTNLSIIVRGEQIPIPADIGLGATEMAIHTHDTDGIIHMEFNGTVRKEDLSLGQFFKVWGKDMRSFGANMRMTLNGATSTAYENYEMRDGDTIVLNYD